MDLLESAVHEVQISLLHIVKMLLNIVEIFGRNYSYYGNTHSHCLHMHTSYRLYALDNYLFLSLHKP